jgi:hypothetical protein
MFIILENYVQPQGAPVKHVPTWSTRPLQMSGVQSSQADLRSPASRGRAFDAWQTISSCAFAATFATVQAARLTHLGVKYDARHAAAGLLGRCGARFTDLP